MAYFYYFLFFVLGLAAGSFLNVVSLRYQPEQKLFTKEIIGGRSRCPACQRQLSWYELIPLFSFFIQKGKCRHCGSKISFQYPLVELLSGLIFVFVPPFLIKNFQLFNYSIINGLIILVWLIIFLLLLLLSIIDWRHYLIPDQINLSLGILGLIIVSIYYRLQMSNYSLVPLSHYSFLGHYALIFGWAENVWLNHFLAALLAMLCFGAIILLSRGKAMGWGDFKFVGVLGLIFGWPDILMVLALAFVFGSLFGIILIIFKKKTLKTTVPFGPFLALGSGLTLFFGYQIINGYFKLFGL